MPHVRVRNAPEDFDQWTVEVVTSVPVISWSRHPENKSTVMIGVETNAEAMEMVMRLNGIECGGNCIEATALSTKQDIWKGSGSDNSSRVPSVSARKAGATPVSTEEEKMEESNTDKLPEDSGEIVDSDHEGSLTCETESLYSVGSTDGGNPNSSEDKGKPEENGRGVRSSFEKRAFLCKSPDPCRFCKTSGHETYDCTESAEYYAIFRSDKEKRYTGKRMWWPIIGKQLIDGLPVGPVIRFFETCHFNRKISRNEMHVLFAAIAKFYICGNCGAAGHRNPKPFYSKLLCDYYPIEEGQKREKQTERQEFYKLVRKARQDLGGLGKMQVTIAEIVANAKKESEENKRAASAAAGGDSQSK